MNAGATDGTRSLFRIAWAVGGAASLAVLLAGCGESPPEAAPTALRRLGFLPGYVTSEAIAVSSDGAVVVGTATTTAGNRQAFRWTAAKGMVGLGFLANGTTSAARAVSADGAVVAGTGDATGGDVPTSSAGFRWTAAGGAQRLDALPDSTLCSAAGVSGDGAVLVGTCLQVNNAAYRWTAGSGPIALDRFGSGSNLQSTAVAISKDGGVVVGAGHPVLTGAVMWPPFGDPVVIGKLPDDAEATATAASRDGSVVVGSSLDNSRISRAFRWTRATGIEGLGAGVDGVTGSYASSVSGDGGTIVGWGVSASGDVALIWDADHGLRRLDAALRADHGISTTGWDLTRATAISDDARVIAGYGTNPQGRTEAWTVTLPD